MKYQAVVFGVLAACTGKVELCSCSVSSGGGVDNAELAKQVKGFAAESATPPLAVRCPKQTTWVAGETFACDVDLTAGTFIAEVTKRANGAGIRWKEPVVGGEHLERMLEKMWVDQQRTEHIDAIDCRDQVVSERPGSRITCTASGGEIEHVVAWIDPADHRVTATYFSPKAE